MAVPSELGRELFEQRAWGDAFALFSLADARSPLADVADLEHLAISALLIGRQEEAVAAWERAHQAALDALDAPVAARNAFWLAFVLLNDGQLARGGGWLQRARHALEDARDRGGLAGVEHAYLVYGSALRSVLQGETEAAITLFRDAALRAEGVGDLELTVLAQVGLGRCLIRIGDAERGMGMLDEAMATVTVDEIGPTAVGDLYCTAIEGCQEVYDVRRAQEWTEALYRWCASQPQLVLYRGQCLVHRAELMLLGGRWSEALLEVERACNRLSRPRSQPALGSAHYVRAELHRLQGRLAEAEQSYRQASSHGHEPMPGMALLWLAQGRAADAEAAMRRVLAETGPEHWPRAMLLGPYAEIALAGLCGC